MALVISWYSAVPWIARTVTVQAFVVYVVNHITRGHGAETE